MAHFGYLEWKLVSSEIELAEVTEELLVQLY